MKHFGTTLTTLSLCGFFVVNSPAQTPGSGAENSEATELLALTKKIDEQTLKIDALSQQLLRLQQEIVQMKGAPTSAPVATAVETSSSSAAQTGSTHIVARGETLTSIAKMHKVGIEDLQKFNHIENDRKLQIGQTLVIPGAQNAAPSPSATTTPNE
jgi:LysM repeat protein